jgi:hypothetical protein
MSSTVLSDAVILNSRQPLFGNHQNLTPTSSASVAQLAKKRHKDMLVPIRSATCLPLIHTTHSLLLVACIFLDLQIFGFGSGL